MEIEVSFTNTEDRNSYIISQIRNSKRKGEVSQSLGLSKRQVKRIRKTHQNNGRLQSKQGSGRPQCLIKIQKLRLLQAVRWNFSTALSTIVMELRLPCTLQTARNYLHLIRYSYKKTQRRPYLTYKNKENRLAFP